MRNSLLKKSLLIVGLEMVCGTLMAQLTLSTIRGTAMDPTGAVIAGANITVVNLRTNEKRVVTTNENGDFEIPDLYRGSYRLTASQTGFKTFVADDVLLEGQQVRRINVTFEVGSLGTEITVTGGAQVLQTDTSRIQGALNTAKHFDTPWVGADD